MGEFPAVQLLNNNGIPAGIVEGATDANNQPAGRCRIGDWDYLSNGNIVITAEDQQVADRYPAQTGGSVGKFRIVTPGGVEVVPWTKIQTDAVGSMELFHGIGVTADGFALRFKDTTLLNFPSGPDWYNDAVLSQRWHADDRGH